MLTRVIVYHSLYYDTDGYKPIPSDHRQGYQYTALVSYQKPYSSYVPYNTVQQILLGQHIKG